MPPNTVKVDRTTKWGNPFKPGQTIIFQGMPRKVIDRAHAFLLYRETNRFNSKLITAARSELAGKNLACWCPKPHNPTDPDICHAAFLLEIANSEIL